MTQVKAKTTRERCGHCRHRVLYRRGACWRCYQTPGVVLRPPHPYARRGTGLHAGRGRPGAVPTDAAPGTEAKIAVLAARAELGQELHHPGDRRGLDGVDPSLLVQLSAGHRGTYS